MRILCNDEKAVKPEMIEMFSLAAELCLEREGLSPDNMEVSISFVSKEEIHELNKAYRNVDSHTDVLSFPLVEDFCSITEDREILLGDVVICLEKAEEQAEEYGHTLQREVVYLFVHSICHLLGYDHMEPEEKAEMRALEEEVMTALELEKPRL